MKEIKKMKNLNIAAGSVFVALSLLALSCAQQVGEIDRVQPNYVKKMDLEGEWYMRATTTESPFASLYTFPGDQGKLERGTFEIQEDSVYFYRTYEFQNRSEIIGHKADVHKPYLRWLDGDASSYSPNSYQNRGLKFAEGFVVDGSGGSVSCDVASKPASGEGTMHEFCQEQVGQAFAYCGHSRDLAVSERTHGNAVCVEPSKYVYRGAPLAAFSVSSHFDIQYTYNPSTGEKTNVRVENTSDRFWYEREFIRVNWGDNKVYNYQFTMSAALDWILASVYEGETAPDGDEFRMYRDDAGEVEYFDYVTKHILLPPMMYYEYWGTDVPMCVFYPHYVGGIFECTSEQIKTRTAFMKVDTTDTYRPEAYNDRRLEKFGFFREERQNYDDLYEVTYTGIIRNVHRWDIWANHVYDADGKPDYSKMDAKPVVYYLSENFPREYVKYANEVVKQWSKPFEDVVKFYGRPVPEQGMIVLCENNNTEAQKAADNGDAMALIDVNLCKDMDEVKRNGDLRYSFIYAVNEPLENAPMGYGPSSADPLTGKILTAAAYIYMGSVELYANYGADIVEVMSGYTDYITSVEGNDEEWDVAPDRLSVGENPPPRTVEEAQGIARGLVREEVRERLGTLGLSRTELDWAGMRMDMLRANPELDRAMVFDGIRSVRRDPMVRLGVEMDDSTFERVALRRWANNRGVNEIKQRIKREGDARIDRTGMTDDAIVALAREWRSEYDTRVCEAVYKAVGEGQDLAFYMDYFDIIKEPCEASQVGQKRDESRVPKLASWSLYDPKLPEAGDTCQEVNQGGFTGTYWVSTCTVAKLGAQIAQKLLYSEQGDQQTYWKPSPWYTPTKDERVARSQEFVRGIAEGIRDEMVADFREKIFLSLTLHEFGHTLGLRHNFEASTDAMNYPREYWDLRVAKDNTGQWVDVDPFKPETDAQKSQRMRELQYSSIMDYGAKFNDLWHGLGLYDHAAIRFGYGGLVDTFKAAPDLSDYQQYLADPSAEGMPGLAPSVADPANPVEKLFKRVHYTKIPNVMGGPDKIYEREFVRLDEIMGKKCTTDADCAGGGGCADCTVCKPQLGEMYCAPENKVEVPYRFCSDEYAGRTPYCDTWDQGADQYEIARNISENYWNYFMFYGRWRGRVLFSDTGYMDRVMYTFDQLKRQYQWWAVEYMRFNSGDWWNKKFGTRWEEDPNGGLTGSMAAYQSFSTLIQVYAIPSGAYTDIRRYGYNSKNKRYETWTSYNDRDLANLFILEENFGGFAARPMYPSWVMVGDEGFPVSGGAIYDRLDAFIALCDPTTDFLNIDEVPDNRQYLLSFYTFFPERMLHLLGGLTTHREANYAPCVVEDPTTKRPQYLRLRDPQNLDDPNFCVDGHYLEPEEVDYDFPTTWYRLPMLAAYYGMSLMINDYDRRFMDTTRVFLKGHEGEIDVPADRKVEAVDPMSGRVYVAYKMGPDDQFDTAWYLVNKAKTIFESFDSLEELQEEYLNGSGELSKTLALLELLRGLHSIYDYTTLGPMSVAPSAE